jgi:hypothetical protein
MLIDLHAQLSWCTRSKIKRSTLSLMLYYWNTSFANGSIVKRNVFHQWTHFEPESLFYTFCRKVIFYPFWTSLFTLYDNYWCLPSFEWEKFCSTVNTIKHLFWLFSTVNINHNVYILIYGNIYIIILFEF